MADKICFGRTYRFGIGIEFSAVQWRLFSLWVSVVRDLNWSNPTQVYYTTWANTNYTNNFAVFYSQYIFNHITIKLFSSCTYHPVHIPFSAILSFYSFTQWEKVILFLYFWIYKYINSIHHQLVGYRYIGLTVLTIF